MVAVKACRASATHFHPNDKQRTIFTGIGGTVASPEVELSTKCRAVGGASSLIEIVSMATLG